MKNLSSNILIIVLLAAAGFLLFRLYEKERKYSDFQEKVVIQLEDKNAVIIDQDQRIYRGNLIIAEKDQRIQNLLDSMDHIKSISGVVRVVTETVIDSVLVPFEVPIYIEKDGSNWLKVPQPFSKIDQWYSVTGTINTTGVLLDSLRYKNDFQILTGVEDHGSWLKNTLRKNNPTVQIKDQNPYSSTQTLQQIVITDRPKRFSIIAGGGYDVRTGVSLGIYGGYRIINF